MTEDLGFDEELKAKYDPKYVAPLCVWLASALSRDCTERVIEASGLGLSVAEGWHRGPTAEPVLDIRDFDGAIRKLLGDARPNATLDNPS